MPEEFFDATIHVMWPKGKKKLGVYQVLACDADQTLYRLQVVGVDAKDAAPTRKRQVTRLKSIAQSLTPQQAEAFEKELDALGFVIVAKPTAT